MFLTPRFKKVIVISSIILLGRYGLTHNPITRPTPQVENGVWSIQYMQHPLLFGIAGHNYLVLRNDKGDIVKEMHGLATDASTNDWKYVGSRSSDLLQVWEFNGSRNYLSSKQYPGIVLISGNQETIETIWTKGENCILPINEKKIPYPPFGFSLKNETKNSNSVAYTLTLCMNLDVRHIGIITPGSEKNLLEN
jgi:hypothetical protein